MDAWTTLKLHWNPVWFIRQEKPLEWITYLRINYPETPCRILRVVQRGIHFSFEINVGERRIRHGPTRKLNDVIFNQFWVDLDVSLPEISTSSQRIELRNFGSELPSGLPLNIQWCYRQGSTSQYLCPKSPRNLTFSTDTIRFSCLKPRGTRRLTWPRFRKISAKRTSAYFGRILANWKLNFLIPVFLK